MLEDASKCCRLRREWLTGRDKSVSKAYTSVFFSKKKVWPFFSNQVPHPTTTKMFQCVRWTVNDAVFDFPNPPQYTVDYPAEGQLTTHTLEAPHVLNIEDETALTVPYARSPKRHLVYVHLLPDSSSEQETAPVVVFFHGKSQDLGSFLIFLLYMTQELKVNVVGFDYSGE